MSTTLSYDEQLKGIAWFDVGLLPETWFDPEIEFVAPPTFAIIAAHPGDSPTRAILAMSVTRAALAASRTRAILVASESEAD